MLWLVQTGIGRRLLEASAQELATANFVHDVFRMYSYEGEVAPPRGSPDSVWLIPTAGQGIRMKLRLGNSERMSILAGAISKDTGVFFAGPVYGQDRSDTTYLVNGRLRGPALVEGVPSIHLEATVRLVLPQSPSYEGTTVRRWSGLLRATGRTQL